MTYCKRKECERNNYLSMKMVRTDTNPQPVHLLPDIKYRPFGSTAKLVTASRWATIEWISLALEKEIVTLY